MKNGLHKILTTKERQNFKVSIFAKFLSALGVYYVSIFSIAKKISAQIIKKAVAT